jgi:hypothetical protein
MVIWVPYRWRGMSGMKLPEHGSYHSTQSIPEIMNEQRFTSTHSICLSLQALLLSPRGNLTQISQTSGPFVDSLLSQLLNSKLSTYRHLFYISASCSCPITVPFVVHDFDPYIIQNICDNFVGLQPVLWIPSRQLWFCVFMLGLATEE